MSKVNIPLCIPHLNGNELKYVQKSIESNWLSSSGPMVDRLEAEFSKYIGCEHSVATTNGTAALHTALLTVGIQPDEEVIVPSLSFIASANAIQYVGAHPLFLDCEKNYLQLDPEKLSEFLHERCKKTAKGLVHSATGRRVTAILAVHALGHPCEMTQLTKLAGEFELTLIEDAAESLGAKHGGKKVGTFGHVACFSFNGNKIITAGGGGILATNRAEWRDRAKHLTTQAKKAEDEYIHDEVGYNYRLPNVLAAIACAQLESLDVYVKEKRAIATRYEEQLATLPSVRTMQEAKEAESTFWMYTMQLTDQSKLTAVTLQKKLSEKGIHTRRLWQPLHKSEAHRGAPFWRCETAEEIYETALSLPCSVGLSNTDQQIVIDAIKEFT